MNPAQLEQLLLLEQSGELSPKQRRQLDAALAASPAARQARAQLRGLAAAIPVPATRPAPAAAARIAARLAPAPKPAFAPAWKSALAAAAALALLLGVRSFQGPRSTPADSPTTEIAAAEDLEWTDPLEAEFTELESLLLAISTADVLEITEL